MAVNRMASYGVGVQNRYSAFLDDEDGFMVLAANAASSAKRIENPHLTTRSNAPTLTKQKGVAQVSGSKQNSVASAVGDSNNKLANKGFNGRIGNQSSKGAHLNGEHQHYKRMDDKHQRASQQQQPNQHGANNFVLAQRQTAANNGKQGNINNQENTANQRNNRFVRTHNANANHNHQSNVSQQQQRKHQQQQNKEISDSSQSHNHQTGGKFVRSNNGQRPQATNRRQNNHDDRNRAHNGQTNDEGNTSSLGAAGIGEEEKRRRQQKRALDLKYKDPEKREARRQQQHGTSAMEQAGDHAAEQTQGELGAGSRAPRSRPQDGALDDGARGFKGAGGGSGSRGRRRRNEQGAVGPKGPGGERRAPDGQQQTNQRVPRSGDDWPPRNRNGFGAGSKGSGRGATRGDDQAKSLGKPIPNFSDKQDFPSLAS